MKGEMTHYNLKLHFPFTISPHWSHFFPFFLFHLIISYFSKQHARLKVIFMILCYISPVSLFHESMVNARTLFGQIFSGRQLELSKFNLQTLITLMISVESASIRILELILRVLSELMKNSQDQFCQQSRNPETRRISSRKLIFLLQ